MCLGSRIGSEQCLFTPIIILEQHKRPLQYDMWSLGRSSRLALFLGEAHRTRRCGCGYAPEPEPESPKLNTMTLDAMSVRLYAPDNANHPQSSLVVLCQPPSTPDSSLRSRRKAVWIRFWIRLVYFGIGWCAADPGLPPAEAGPYESQ